MKKVNRTAVLFMAVLISMNAAVPAFAEEPAPSAAYTVPYAQVEQMVLNNNLQADSNERTIGSMNDENELKEKYDKLSTAISQASSGMSAIVNNPQSTPDLKAVAQGTNVTLESLSALIDSQEDTSDDDYELTELQVRLSDNQLVESAQSMFSVYYQLQYNIEQFNNTRVVLGDALKAAQSQYESGLGTSVAVADAQAALGTLDNQIADLQNQSKSIGYQMNRLLGHSYNDQITFGPLPEPDTGYAANISLANDLTAAQEASYKVQISKKERSILSDDTVENRDKRQIKSNEAELERQNIGAALESQYDKIKKQQAVLATEQQKAANAKLKFDQARKKYDLGCLSKMELDRTENDYFTERTAVKTAAATLFWQIESYKWIVKGLPAS